jgi:hypothetical protein
MIHEKTRIEIHQIRCRSLLWHANTDSISILTGRSAEESELGSLMKSRRGLH